VLIEKVIGGQEGRDRVIEDSPYLHKLLTALIKFENYNRGYGNNMLTIPYYLSFVLGRN